MKNTPDYYDVTEISGTKVSVEQLNRMCQRYYWAKNYCIDRDVLEVACGSGQGLGYLANYTKSIEGGDYSSKILINPIKYYNKRIKIKQFDAHELPYNDNSKDVIIIFEAIYYLQSFHTFLKECKRVLRNNGLLLISTANKDLFDFNPSPYTYEYYGVSELNQVLKEHNFNSEFYGDVSIKNISLRQKVFRPLKKLAVKLNLIPKSMLAKIIFKKIVFGKMIDLPFEIENGMVTNISPTKIKDNIPNTEFKVILCCASLQLN